jgi:hypothetical protein
MSSMPLQLNWQKLVQNTNNEVLLTLYFFTHQLLQTIFDLRQDSCTDCAEFGHESEE